MAKELTELEKHYNKFNEEKRLGRRHGQVEYRITMEYIRRYLKEMEQPKILDVGAGTGRYSVALANEGYDVTAVELVKYNLLPSLLHPVLPVSLSRVHHTLCS